MIVYDRPQVAQVMAQQRPVTLLSPPGFASYGGCLWWWAMIEGFAAPSLLDCADGAGRALEALRFGLHGVVLSRDAPNFERIALIARECDALLLDRAPKALDLAEQGAERRLAAWLGQGSETG